MSRWLKAKSAIAIGTAVTALAMTAAAEDTKGDPKFCANVNALNSRLSELEKVDAKSTVNEVRTTAGHVEADAKELQKAGQQKLTTHAGTQLEGAVNQLQQTVASVSSQEALDKARDTIKGHAHDAHQAGKQVAVESHCAGQ